LADLRASNKDIRVENMSAAIFRLFREVAEKPVPEEFKHLRIQDDEKDLLQKDY